MATKFKLNDCVPCIAIHPGEIIKDELDAREMKQKELASFMGMPTSVLNDIITVSYTHLDVYKRQLYLFLHL